ncbi:hypothetical protein AB0G73_25055 [Streptomyces sp. NPDC020719]|uniref:DUF7848 domain-containing protein n=1 Tax=Streptomyces sp. NPDC020719 TaxID=3154896 RepID=UPI0033DFC17D
MSTRALFTYAVHRIGRHPEGELALTARCLDADCRWELAATSDLEAGDEACMTHTGLNPGHDRFERQWSEVSLVTRVDGAAVSRAGSST